MTRILVCFGLSMMFTFSLFGCSGGDKKAIKPETFEEKPKTGPSGAGTGDNNAPPPPAN